MNTSRNQIDLGDICFDVLHKDIKNVHLSVHPPLGRVTISAPRQMDLETLRLFSISKLGWIRKQQVKLRAQKREMPREYIARESHYYLGQRYLLKVVEQDAAPKVVLRHSTIELHLRQGTSTKQREALMQSWYREQLKELLPRYVAKWEEEMGVKVERLGVRAMKTRWGSCDSSAKRILLNTELAKKSIESIEFVLVHEMVHLLERHHNEKFIAHMDKFLPNWRHFREELNRSALGHVEWSY